jgi:hypothetical protein
MMRANTDRVRIRVVIASGYLSAASIVSAQPHLAQWSNELSGAGLDGFVLSLAVFDDGSGRAIYAGGEFEHASGVLVNRISKWNGIAWCSLDGGVSGNNGGNAPNRGVQAMLGGSNGASTTLYVAGGFAQAGTAGGSIVGWTGAEWLDMGGGVLGSRACFDCPAGVYALAVDPASSAVIVAGTFEYAGLAAHNNIAAWNGQGWRALGSGLQGSPLLPNGNALAYYDAGAGPVLYVGGMFWGAGGVNALGIARWDGTSWSDVGSGVVGGPFVSGFLPGITDFVVFDDGFGPALYAAGNFVEVDGLQTSNIARWDGQAWSSVGGGTNGPLDALAVFDDGSGPALYVGGSFSTAGGVAANNIARWDGISWSNLDTGVIGEVHAMATLEEKGCRKLYVGGLFTEAVGIDAENIAVWAACTCYADCDKSTGNGVLDIFDFLCFQNSFVSADPYACDCDTTTGPLVCDIFDFLCFQNAFASGCP